MQNSSSRKVIFFLILIIIMLVLVVGYFYNQNSILDVTPEQVAQKEASMLAEQIGKLIVLPEGETPTVATVSDPAALSDQPFFAGAKKGDKVLIYTNAKKAILYDPIANKIVNVAPLNIGGQE